MIIKTSKTQLPHNMKIEGGFLPALSELIPLLTGTVLPALGVGSLSALASSEVEKRIGNGLYVKKGSGVCVCRIELTERGCILAQQAVTDLNLQGNGLYLMKQCGLYDTRGLILGPNSPFKNIPILGMILKYFL